MFSKQSLARFRSCDMLHVSTIMGWICGTPAAPAVKFLIILCTTLAHYILKMDGLLNSSVELLSLLVDSRKFPLLDTTAFLLLEFGVIHMFFFVKEWFNPRCVFLGERISKDIFHGIRLMYIEGGCWLNPHDVWKRLPPLKPKYHSLPF